MPEPSFKCQAHNPGKLHNPEDLLTCFKRLVPPEMSWDARHMATAYFEGLEGDVRIQSFS
jgi:hypothetical protein